MEFFQFLKNSVDAPEKKEATPTKESSSNNKGNKIDNFINGRTPKKREKHASKQANQDENKAYLRSGLKIRVIFKPGSRLNYYKDYIGEIKYYKSPNDYALVVLWAMNSLNQIRMPVDHFQIID